MKEFDHRFLHRHVQGTGSFVTDDDFRLQYESPGDGDALALAAGHIVRIAVCKILRQVHQAQHFPGFGSHFFFPDETVVSKGFADNVFDPLLGVKGRGGVLKNHLDIFPGLPEFFPCKGGHILSVKEDAPAVHGVEACQDFGQGGFSGARFPDDTQGFSFVEADIYMIRGGELFSAAQVEGFHNVLHAEDFFSISLHAVSPPSTGTAARSIFV